MSSFARAGRLWQQDPSNDPRPKADRELWLLLAGLTALYLVAVFFSGRRFVWYDELFTFDIAKAASIGRLWQMLRNFDANPPTSYLLSRLSMSILGQNSWGLRMPSMLEFYLGSLAIFFYIRRKAGTAFATLAALILWSSPAFNYATEARPYAQLFMFAAFLLLAWDSATRSANRRPALCGVGLSSLGLFSAHVLAPFSVFPFIAAEAVRFWRRRKPDYALWAALVLPGIGMLSYIHIFNAYQILFPSEFQASPGRLATFFYESFSSISFTLFFALLTMLLVARPGKKKSEPAGFGLEDIALFAAFVISPMLMTIALMLRQGAFWNRYAITTQAALYVALAIFLGRRFSFSRRGGYAAALIMLSLVIRRDVSPYRRITTPANEDALVSVRPDLPLVDASELTYFEMNHYESPRLLSRLYYLRNRGAAIQYAHATMFEDFEPPDRMKPYFPISANVDQYDRFVRQHNQFLVFGTDGYPEDWLLRKLRADGAQLSVVGDYPGPYKDSTLYLVTLRPAP